MAHDRYRVTRAAFEVVSVFGCLNAKAIPGSVMTAVLTDRGWTASNVRNQITRLADRGLLSREKHGRHTLYRMSPDIHHRYQAIGGNAEIPDYEGYFYALFYSIPESERTLRDRLIYTARYNEFELLRPGVLIGLHDMAESVLSQMGEVNGGSWILSGRVTPKNLAEAKKMATIAFTPADMRERIRVIQEDAAKVIQDETVSMNKYFDVYYDASRELVQLPHVPEDLVAGPRPAQELGIVIGQLNQLFVDRYYPRVCEVAESVSGSELIERAPWGGNASPEEELSGAKA